MLAKVPPFDCARPRRCGTFGRSIDARGLLIDKIEAEGRRRHFFSRGRAGFRDGSKPPTSITSRATRHLFCDRIRCDAFEINCTLAAIAR